MRKLLRNLFVTKSKREQDVSNRKEITPADRVRAARAVQASDSAKARARFEQKSREEKAVGVPSEPVPARERPPTAPPERSPSTPAHSVDKPSTSRPHLALKDFPRELRIAIRGVSLAIGVWIIVDALVYDSVLIPHSGGKHTGFEEHPLIFLETLGIGFFIVGWSISPILRAVMSKINHNRR